MGRCVQQRPTGPYARWMVRAEAVLIDIDGVLVVSWEAIPGAAETITRCRAAGLGVRFLTNTTSASRAEVCKRLDAAGVHAAEDEIFTAPAATAAWIRETHPTASCYLINSGDLGADLAGVRLVDSAEPADLVILGGAGPEFSYSQMNHALGLLLAGATLVGMHRNRYWRTAEGFSLDTGAYLAALELSADTTATVIGKPSAPFFRAALDSLSVEPGAAVMVGDDVENDVVAAQSCGVTGVLVRTGKFRQAELDGAAGTPDHVIDSVADLPGLLGL